MLFLKPGATRMILIGVSLLFLVIGVWEHGRKLTIFLFLLLLGCGVWDVAHPEAPVLAALRRLWP